MIQSFQLSRLTWHNNFEIDQNRCFFFVVRCFEVNRTFFHVGTRRDMPPAKPEDQIRILRTVISICVCVMYLCL